MTAKVLRAFAMIAAAWGSASSAIAQALPTTPPSRIVVVVMENHAAGQIIGAPEAPYINALAKSGAYFASSFGVAHPSEPNYLALFSGSTHGLKKDVCPLTLSGPNLAQALIAAGKTFVGYSEGLPSTGFKGCIAPDGYARKHAPWVNFPKLPASTNQPFARFPGADFEQLPTVAFVIPNLNNDMHDGTVAEGDAWLQANIDPYLRWADTHNALLIVTWDEDDSHNKNQIPTIFYGPMVKADVYTDRIDHYSVLRTIEDLYSLPRSGRAKAAAVIDKAWSPDSKN